LKELSAEYLRDHYDTMLKSINLLLAAHGAGFIACLAALKDYDSIPRLKGVGIILAIEGFGLIATALLHVSTHFARSAALFEIAISRESTEGWAAFAVYVILLVGAFGSFIATVGILSYRFASL
jgi:hypothetical protein